jgi:fatty acid desaturase
MASSAPRRSGRVRFISPVKLVVLVAYLAALWMAGGFLAARFLAWIGYPDLSP